MIRVALVANTDWYLYNFRIVLARTLREHGFEVVLISPPGPFTGLLEEAGFRWLGWDVARSETLPWQEARALWKLARLYWQERPEIIHHFTIKPVLYGSFAGKLAGISRVVNSITGRGYLFMRDTRYVRALRLLVKPFYRLALQRRGTIVTFENPEDLTYFQREGLIRPGQGKLIEGAGVDPDVFAPVPEPPEPPLVILPARMLWDKGVGTLAEAARILKKARCPVRVALVGNLDPGNPAAIDEATIQDWVSEKILEWWGFQEDMSQVYRAAHIVTLPSMGEGLPTALIEAAACARPVVTTDVPGCRNVVKDGITGLLVPPEDPRALAEALDRLARDAELRKRLGYEGRQFVLERFTHKQVNSAILHVYNDLLNPSQ